MIVGLILCAIAGITAPIRLDVAVALALAYVGGVLIGRAIVADAR